MNLPDNFFQLLRDIQKNAAIGEPTWSNIEGRIETILHEMSLGCTMNKNSKTPRTDAVLDYCNQYPAECAGANVILDLCRVLERELAETEADKKRWMERYAVSELEKQHLSRARSADDDAQAMALVKKFKLKIGFGFRAKPNAEGALEEGQLWRVSENFSGPYTWDADLNRAIVECVATKALV